MIAILCPWSIIWMSQDIKDDPLSCGDTLSDKKSADILLEKDQWC